MIRVTHALQRDRHSTFIRHTIRHTVRLTDGSVHDCADEIGSTNVGRISPKEKEVSSTNSVEFGPIGFDFLDRVDVGDSVKGDR